MLLCAVLALVGADEAAAPLRAVRSALDTEGPSADAGPGYKHKHYGYGYGYGR